MSLGQRVGGSTAPRVRLLGIALGLTGLLLGAMLVPPWLRATIPEQAFRRAAQTLLLAAQPAYGVTLALLVTTLGVGTPTVVRARRRGKSRPWGRRLGAAGESGNRLGPDGSLLGAMLIPPWLRATIPEHAFRRAAQTLLLAAQPAYGVTLALLVTALGMGSPTLIRARRRGQSRPWVARGLLLCGSALLAIVVAEAAAGFWRAGAHRLPALPTRFDDESEANRALNVVVIGGSSAYGLPFEKWLSTGHIVHWKLGEAIPQHRFSLDVLAENGVHLERMHQKLAQYRRKPDLLIIYCGHNEFTYRYRWSRSAEHYTDEIPNRPTRLLRQLAGRYSPLCRMIQEAIEANGLGEPPPPEVTRQLVDVPACSPEEYATRLDDFSRRLEAIVAAYERVGCQIVLLIPPGNGSGFEPNRSILPPGTPRADREAFSQRFLAVRANEEADPAKAVAAYRAILDEQPGFAEAHFRLARLLGRAGDRDGADSHFRAARNLDALPMRCPADFQDAYRKVAASHPLAVLVDGQQALRFRKPARPPRGSTVPRCDASVGPWSRLAGGGDPRRSEEPWGLRLARGNAASEG